MLSDDTEVVTIACPDAGVIFDVKIVTAGGSS